MKKVKIMLVVITILATIAGAVSFKAKWAWDEAFCTIATTSPGQCSEGPQNCLMADGRTTDWGGEEVCYTATINNSCNGVTNCVNLTLFTLDAEP